MENLQDKINSEFCVKINPKGIDYSNFNLNKIIKYISKNMWDDKANFGILLEDEQKRQTELIGSVRHFERKAQRKLPIKTDIILKDEQFNLSPLLMDYISVFFRSLSNLKFPDGERTTHYKGEFKEVTIKRKISNNNFWKKTFIDLYVENDSLIDKLDTLNIQSKGALKENRFWKKYEGVRKYVRSLQENLHFLSNDSNEKNILESRDLLKFLRTYYFSPQFEKRDDYKYFLLGFYRTNFNIENIHKKIKTLFDKQSYLEKCINEFENKTKTLNGFSGGYLNVNKKYKIFAPEINQNELDESYKDVLENGNMIRTPVTLSQDLWDLGFFPLKRNRKIQPTTSSYALIKVKGTGPYYQKVLPFKEFKNSIELPEDDYTPRENIYNDEDNPTF